MFMIFSIFKVNVVLILIVTFLCRLVGHKDIKWQNKNSKLDLLSPSPGLTTMPHATYNEKIDTLVFETAAIVLF